MLLSLGFALLAGVATISVVRTGLRELRERHLPAVRTLARELEQMPLGLSGPNAPLGLTLFRAKYPTVRFVAVGSAACRSECLLSSDDRTTPLKARLTQVWPSDAGGLSIASVGDRSVLLIAEPLRDAATSKDAVVVVGVDAEFLAVQATRTAWTLLAIAYSLLLIVGWSSWQQLNSSLGHRIDAITRQVRAGSVGEESEKLEIDGKELSELAEAVATYIHTTLEEQKSSDERYRRLVELAPDGVLMCSTTGIKFANSAALALAGVRNRYDVIGSPIEKFLQFEPMRAGEQVPGSLRPAKWRRVDGTELQVEVAEITASGRATDGRQYMIRDVTDRRVREAALAHRAEHDSLTGLVNRARFEVRLNDLLDARERAPRSAPQQHVAVLFIDLDGFKPVNDRYGHAAGDAVLIGVASRLRESTRGTDVIARFGGDEFAVLVEVRDHDEVNAVAERILHSLKRPFLYDGYELSVGASIGIADSRMGETGSDSPDPSDRPLTATELLHAADTAMYAAKASGGRRYGVTPLPSTQFGASQLEESGVNFRVVA
ncbi:MAG: phosphodiesterase [Gemmatimonadetes bacterium]|nr:phosphodiesterase [Gemmatimonadota bacterium]